jgi:hypothetical protein
MVSFGHDPIINHKNRADRGIRTRPAERLSCLFQCSAHELCVAVGRHVIGEIVSLNSDNACLEGFEPPTF